MPTRVSSGARRTRRKAQGSALPSLQSAVAQLARSVVMGVSLALWVFFLMVGDEDVQALLFGSVWDLARASAPVITVGLSWNADVGLFRR